MFEFDKFYKQIQGTAIGTKLAPIYLWLHWSFIMPISAATSDTQSYVGAVMDMQ